MTQAAFVPRRHDLLAIFTMKKRPHQTLHSAFPEQTVVHRINHESGTHGNVPQSATQRTNLPFAPTPVHDHAATLRDLWPNLSRLRAQHHHRATESSANVDGKLQRGLSTKFCKSLWESQILRATRSQNDRHDLFVMSAQGRVRINDTNPKFQVSTHICDVAIRFERPCRQTRFTLLRWRNRTRMRGRCEFMSAWCKPRLDSFH